MQDNYFDNITSKWKCYLAFQGYPYTFDERTGEIVFKASSSAASEELEFTVKSDANNYCVYAKLPLQLDNDKLDAVSSYIHSANRDTLFAHFTLDYDTNTLNCVSGSFCGSKEVGFEEIDNTLKRIHNFLECHYIKLALILETPVTGDAEKRTLPNTIGIDFFL